MPMWLYYLPYSLAFFALGFTMSLAAREPVAVIPRISTWLLCAFGFLHGFHEWEELLEEMGRPLGPLFPPLHVIDLAWMVLGWLLLAHAGIEIIVTFKRAAKWLRALPLVTLIIWFAFLPWATRDATPYISEGWENACDALARYFIALPAGLLTSYALIRSALARTGIQERKIRRYLILAGCATLGYILTTGLVPDPAPFFPARTLNTENFARWFPIPDEGIRALFGFMLAGCLSEATLVESSRIQTLWQRLREEFIAIVAHDLRAPITVISMNAELLALRPPETLSERDKTAIDNIRSSVTTLNQMLSDLVDATNVETKKVALNKSRVDLRDLIPHVAERAASLTRGFPVKLNLPKYPVIALADPRRIEQVLDNLLTNAGKHARPGSQIDLSMRVRENEIIISVSNFGPSIPPEEQAKIFLRYYQVGRMQRDRAAGLGLGLYIVKGLVEAHSGRVILRSQHGLTTFAFTLPLAAGTLRPRAQAA